MKEDAAQLKAKVHEQESDIKVQEPFPQCVHTLRTMMSSLVTPQDRTDGLEQQKTTIDRVNREHAQLKLKRDELMNQRK